MNKITTIYVPSKGKPETASTPLYFKKCGFKNFVMVVCFDDNAAAYKKTYGCKVLIAPASAKTLPQKMEWLIKTQASKGDWIFTMDDNVTEVNGELFSKPLTRERADQFVTVQQLLRVVNADISKAEYIGAVLGGFASNGNFFFRKRQYRTVGFIWRKMCYYKNVGIQWAPIQHMDDYAMTALSLLYSGRVLINNFLYATARRYEKIGGDGSYEKRVPGKTIAAAFLVNNFNGLFRYADRPGLALKTEIRMRFTSTKQVDKWRAQYFNLTPIKK